MSHSVSRSLASLWFQDISEMFLAMYGNSHENIEENFLLGSSWIH